MIPIFVGRFQPFHKGHLKVIKEILKNQKKILIFIGSLQESFTQRNPFSFKERKEMIEKTLWREKITNFEILGICDFADDLVWAKKLLRTKNLKREEVIVFTQNPWTRRCLEKIGVKVLPHSLFFRKEKKGVLCATKIRERISQNKEWKDLVPETIFEYLKKNKGVERIRFLSILPEERIISFIKEKVRESHQGGVVLGISGGIDSAVSAVLAKRALGKKTIFLNITFEKESSLNENLALLEKRLKTKIKRIELKEAFEKILKCLPKTTDNLTLGNLKPRLRMIILYYFANLNNFLVMGTSNKSELELGYFTKYGDAGVDIVPLGDLYKTEVIEMAKRLQLPSKILATVPSANLWPGQTDEKELGLSYQKIDTILKLLNQGFSKKDISFYTEIPKEKIKKILELKNKNFHKLSFPPICSLKRL